MKMFDSCVRMKASESPEWFILGQMLFWSFYIFELFVYYTVYVLCLCAGDGDPDRSFGLQHVW